MKMRETMVNSFAEVPPLLTRPAAAALIKALKGRE